MSEELIKQVVEETLLQIKYEGFNLSKIREFSSINTKLKIKLKRHKEYLITSKKRIEEDIVIIDEILKKKEVQNGKGPYKSEVTIIKAEE